MRVEAEFYGRKNSDRSRASFSTNDCAIKTTRRRRCLACFAQRDRAVSPVISARLEPLSAPSKSPFSSCLRRTAFATLCRNEFQFSAGCYAPSGLGGLSFGDLAFWFSAVLFDKNVNDQKPLPDNVFASRRSVRWWYQLFVC
jgi:hypothetical protein